MLSLSDLSINLWHTYRLMYFMLLFFNFLIQYIKGRLSSILTNITSETGAEIWNEFDYWYKIKLKQKYFLFVIVFLLCDTRHIILTSKYYFSGLFSHLKFFYISILLYFCAPIHDCKKILFSSFSTDFSINVSLRI